MFRAPIDSGYPELTVIAEKGAVVTADGLAVDWVYNHVYWTDTGEQRLQLTYLLLYMSPDLSLIFLLLV